MRKHTEKPRLLDTTLRDGSFLIDFQFSLDDVRKTAVALEKAGVELMEVSHGFGVGSGDHLPQFKAAHSDHDYVLTARRAINGKIKLGVLADPQATQERHMQPLWELIDFVRIGVNLSEPQKALRFIEQVKAAGKTAFLQLVRSSMIKDKSELVPLARSLRDAGADVIYVVDTGGFMLPREAFETIVLIREKTGLPVGFHGHNHLQLAVANTLSALSAGAEYVDGCLHSMGKGAGNAQTEVLAHLINAEFDGKYDTEILLDAAEKIILPLIKSKTAAGTQASQLRAAFYRMDFEPIVMKAIREKTGVSERDVLEEFSRLPDFLGATAENLPLVLERLYAKFRAAS